MMAEAWRSMAPFLIALALICFGLVVTYFLTREKIGRDEP
jgi:predicted peroxiredoxin